jgi:hypothetical protein
MLRIMVRDMRMIIYPIRLCDGSGTLIGRSYELPVIQDLKYHIDVFKREL